MLLITAMVLKIGTEVFQKRVRNPRKKTDPGIDKGTIKRFRCNQRFRMYRELIVVFL
jgi:hypothetical protein